MKIRSAVLGRDDHLAVNDRLVSLDVPSSQGHPFEPLRPIMSSAGEQSHTPFVDVELQPIAVVFDFMHPLIAAWRLRMQSGQRRFDEAWIWRRPRAWNPSRQLQCRKCTHILPPRRRQTLHITPSHSARRYRKMEGLSRHSPDPWAAPKSEPPDSASRQERIQRRVLESELSWGLSCLSTLEKMIRWSFPATPSTSGSPNSSPRNSGIE